MTPRPLLFVAALIAIGGSGQTPPGAPQTFRSGAQVIQVDVRVLGKDGRFVTDLGLGDFEIAEDGVPQKLVSILLIGSAPAAPVAPAPSGAPGVSGAPARPPQLWVFVFDSVHLSPGGLTRARDAVVTFLGGRFQPGDVAGIVADGRMANNRLTTDLDELKKAAAAVRITGDARSLRLELQEWPRLRDESEAFAIANEDREAIQSALARACSDDPTACRRAPPDAEVRSKARRLVATYKSASRLTLSVVDTLSRGLARREGPKTIVFFSEGFVLQEQEAELREAVGQAARAGAHFYTVDARGLNTGAGASLIDQPVADSTIGVSPRFDMHADGTNSLAVDTGGFAIRNENNFGRALDDIQRDAGTYYVIGYVPARDALDGKYRAISVKVTRPDVKVRARRGYLAIEPAALLRPAKAVTPQTEAVPDGLPLVPASPSLIALPVVVPASLPGDPPLTDAVVTASPAAMARTRIDTGKLMLTLGKPTNASPGPAQLGWAAYERGDVETAARHLGEAADAVDARPWVSYALGLSHFALRHYPEAAVAWERVRREVPEFEPIYFSIADAYGLQREDTLALKVLRDAEHRWPSDPEVANAIGVFQIRRGALDAAVESFTRATTVAPGDALGYFNLARAHQMRLLKSQRYDPQMQKWIGGDDDRRRAIATFQKYLELGGPYERQAREALSTLEWK